MAFPGLSIVHTRNWGRSRERRLRLGRGRQSKPATPTTPGSSRRSPCSHFTTVMQRRALAGAPQGMTAPATGRGGGSVPNVRKWPGACRRRFNSLSLVRRSTPEMGPSVRANNRRLRSPVPLSQASGEGRARSASSLALPTIHPLWLPGAPSLRG